MPPGNSNCISPYAVFLIILYHCFKDIIVYHYSVNKSQLCTDLFLFFFSLREDSAIYLSGLGTMGLEIYEQVPKLDAVIFPAGGHCGLLAGSAAALKHLNPHISVIVSSFYFSVVYFESFILLSLRLQEGATKVPERSVCTL